MRKTLLIDIDGVLCEPRQKVMKPMRNWLNVLSTMHNIMLVTGSDISKIAEQFENDYECLDSFVKIYACLGNACYARGTRHSYFRHYIEDEELLKSLKDILDNYQGTKLGCHIEERYGMINFSLIGRNANNFQRRHYAETENERLPLIKELSKKFPEYQFLIGGQISIDITKIGCGKEQVLEHENPESCVFFCDRLEEYGNDYELARKLALQGGVSWYTLGPDEFMNISKEYMIGKDNG